MIFVRPRPTACRPECSRSLLYLHYRCCIIAFLDLISPRERETGRGAIPLPFLLLCFVFGEYKPFSPSLLSPSRRPLSPPTLVVVLIYSSMSKRISPISLHPSASIITETRIPTSPVLNSTPCSQVALVLPASSNPLPSPSGHRPQADLGSVLPLPTYSTRKVKYSVGEDTGGTRKRREDGQGDPHGEDSGADAKRALFARTGGGNDARSGGFFCRQCRPELRRYLGMRACVQVVSL